MYTLFITVSHSALLIRISTSYLAAYNIHLASLKHLKGWQGQGNGYLQKVQSQLLLDINNACYDIIS